MPSIEIGRTCVKTMGGEKGKRCVIVGIVDKSFVLITGPESLTGVKRRRTNVNHLELLNEKIQIKRHASDDEVVAALRAK